MILTLEQLMAKEKTELTSFEAKVVETQVNAVQIRKKIEELDITQIHGITYRFGEEPEQTDEEWGLEFESMGRGYIALGHALEYLTQEKTVPLTEQQYFAFKKYVEANYPQTMWDHNLWCRRFNKVVNEWDIPVDDNVVSYMAENNRLFVQASLQEAEALKLDVPVEKLDESMFGMQIVHLWPMHGPEPTYEVFEAKLNEMGFEGDAKEFYETLKQLNSPIEDQD